MFPENQCKSKKHNNHAGYQKVKLVTFVGTMTEFDTVVSFMRYSISRRYTDTDIYCVCLSILITDHKKQLSVGRS